MVAAVGWSFSTFGRHSTVGLKVGPSVVLGSGPSLTASNRYRRCKLSSFRLRRTSSFDGVRLRAEISLMAASVVIASGRSCMTSCCEVRVGQDLGARIGQRYVPSK